MFKIGDIINEKHHPKRIGVVVEVHHKKVTVHWQRPNPNSGDYMIGSHIEKLGNEFIELIKDKEAPGNI